MKTKVNHPGQKTIQSFIQGEMDQYKQQVIKYLFVIGEKCVNEARLNGTYQNPTGNLRGSIGYAVVDDGRIVQAGGFKQVKEGTEGPAQGMAYVNEILAGNSFTGPTLILVAGRNYAKHVEDYGYNVLDSAELLAEKLVKELTQKIGQ